MRTSLVRLSQNQLCQQGPGITVTEHFHPQWPFTVVAFETGCPSHSCSTLLKYFKWLRCGAITRLLDKHQFIHQAADGRAAGGYVLGLLAVVGLGWKLFVSSACQGKI